MSTAAPATPPVIDFHVHLLDEQVSRATEGHTVFYGFGAGNAYPRQGRGPRVAKMYDPAMQVADMDARGIDAHVVTSSTVIQGTTWADPQADFALCRACNDRTAEWVSRHPRRFIGSFVLPLQDMTLALTEFTRAVEQLGLRVANVSSNYRGAYLGEAVFDPFWDAVQSRDLVTWIHPEGITDPWFQRYALWNSAGQSIEEARAMASLIYEGVLTRRPGLKLVMAHGGGYFPHYLGRMDRNAVNRPDTLRNTGGRKPSDFLGEFFYDTCVYDPAVVQSLLARVGASRLVMGSDYPVGEDDPVGFLRRCGLEGEALSAVCGGNAARLLGLT